MYNNITDDEWETIFTNKCRRPYAVEVVAEMDRRFIALANDKKEEPMLNPGKIAYDAYCKASGGVSLVSGANLPDWLNLSEPIRFAWEAAATAVMNAASND